MLLENITSIDDIEKNIKEILKDIDKHAIFVESGSSKQEILKKATIMVSSHTPSIFVIAGIKHAAKRVNEYTEQLKIILEDYDFEKISATNKEILFFRKRLDKKQTSDKK